MRVDKYIIIVSMIVLCVSTTYCIKAEAETTEAYPNIKFLGYKKYNYDYVNASTSITPEAYFTDIPDGQPWNEELRMAIKGSLNKDLSLFYGLDQLPKQPDIFNVGITYGQNRLMYGLLNDVYYSEHFLPAKVSGVIGSTNIFGFTPFFVSGATMNTKPYESDDTDLTLPFNYAYKDPLYYGSKAFPVQGNHENQRDKEYLIRSRAMLHDYSLFDPPDEYMDLTPESNRFFLINSAVQPNSDAVYVDGQRRYKDLDYDINYSRGELLFLKDLSDISDVKADYSILNIENRKDVNGGGFSWAPNSGFNMAAGYLSSTSKTEWKQDFTVTNLSARYAVNESNKLQLDLNSSDYGKGASLESEGAYSITYDFRLGKLNIRLKENIDNLGYAYHDLVMLGERKKRDQSTLQIEYDLSGGHISTGMLKCGEITINETTNEAIASYYNKSNIVEAGATIDEWLELSTRYQNIAEKYALYPRLDPDITDSLLGTASINLDKFFGFLKGPSKIYLKDLQENYRYAHIPYEGMSRNELGTLNTFGPFSLLLSRAIQTSTSVFVTSEVASQYRLTYEFEPLNTTIVYGWSEMDGGFGPVLYNDKKTELSFVYDMPEDAQLFFRLSCALGIRKIIHHENRGYEYDYDANQLNFNATIYF